MSARDVIANALCAVWSVADAERDADGILAALHAMPAAAAASAAYAASASAYAYASASADAAYAGRLAYSRMADKLCELLAAVPGDATMEAA